MAEDSSRQGQSDPLAVILPTILSAVLTGKQPNVSDLLTSVLTGRPAVTQGGQVAPTPQQQPTDPLSLLLPILIGRITGAPAAGAATSATPATPSTQPPNAALKQVKDLLDAFKGLIPQQPSALGTAPSQDQTQKILDILKVIVGGTGKLGPVNGALGQTIGNLLDGKKSAIGIIGGVITAASRRRVRRCRGAHRRDRRLPARPVRAADLPCHDCLGSSRQNGRSGPAIRRRPPNRPVEALRR